MSYNRAPAADLAPWVGRLYATVVDVPAGYRLECGLLNDSTVIRIQLEGNWEAQTADGWRKLGPSALIFGPQTKVMPVCVTGSFVSVGIALRPGSGRALNGVEPGPILDRLISIEEAGLEEGPAIERLRALDGRSDPELWLCELESRLREIVAAAGGRHPDPVSSRFELLCFTNPNATIASFAERCGISPRQLERIIRRDFGMPPKQVLRRARALDMASHLRGVADVDEAEELALRYYDQSHLTREFTELFGLSPRQFVSSPQPLLTLALESRQARRLEAIERLQPGAQRPWQ